MRRCIIIYAFFISFSAHAQDIGNEGFENWHSEGSFLVPDSFRTKDQITFSGIPTVSKSNESHSGQFAAAIQNIYLSPGVGISGQMNYGSMVNSGGSIRFFGWPVSGRPAVFRFWYKFSRNGTDTAQVSVSLSRWNSQHEIVGSGVMNIVNPATSYTSAEINILYTSADLPDTINIGFVSGANLVPTPGTILYVDDLSFDTNTNLTLLTSSPLTVYPNPAKESCRISFPNGLNTAQLMDMQGRCVRKLDVSSDYELDISGLKDGIYYLKGESDCRKAQVVVISH